MEREKPMSQEIDYNGVVQKIVAATGLSREEIMKRVYAKAAENVLYTPYSAAATVADNLGVTLIEKPPVLDPKDKTYHNDAGVCSTCHGKKTWESKVLNAKSGKMMPAHITDDGHLIGDCPSWNSGGAKPAAKADKPLDAEIKKSLAFDAPLALAIKLPVKALVCPKCGHPLEGDGMKGLIGTHWLCGDHMVIRRADTGAWMVESDTKPSVPALVITMPATTPKTSGESQGVRIKAQEANPMAPAASANGREGKVEAAPFLVITLPAAQPATPAAILTSAPPWIPTRTSEYRVGMNTQEDHDISITSIPQLADYARALEALPAFLSGINTKLEKLGVKDGIAGWMYEMLATKKKVVEMTNVDLQQQAINTVALAAIEERLNALELANVLQDEKAYPHVVETCSDGALVQYECKACHEPFEAYTSPSDVYCSKHVPMEPAPGDAPLPAGIMEPLKALPAKPVRKRAPAKEKAPAPEGKKAEGTVPAAEKQNEPKGEEKP